MCNKIFKVFGVVLTLFAFSGEVLAADNIKVGISAAFSGPAKALGNGIKSGIELYFAEVNKAGGINGSQLELVALDDSYEPKKVGPNVRQLIDDKSILAILGNVGTPTAVVTVPIVNEKKIMLFGAFTGAGLLRKNPPDRYVINYRASYAEETAAMVEGLLKSGIKPEEIAFFTQNDGYGDAGYKGAIAALKAKGFNKAGSLAHGRYERNTVNVEDGLGAILDSDIEPKAIIMVGSYKPCAAFIKLAKEELPEVKFLNVSFVGSRALAKELGDKGDGVIVTQVVPHYDSDLVAVKSYKAALKNYAKNKIPDFVSLEGYLLAKVFVEGLKKSKTPLTRESVIDGVEAIGKLDIGIGVDVNLSAKDHQASHKIWPTVLKNGKFELLEW